MIQNKYLSTLLIALVLSGCALNKNKKAREISCIDGSSIIQKWKKAVIHLECAESRESICDITRRAELLKKLLQTRNINTKKIFEEMSSNSRDIRVQGTSLFVNHKGRRYLVTARHVVKDEVATNRKINEKEDFFSTLPENQKLFLKEYAKEKESEQIYSIIFRVPSLDEILNTPSSSPPCEFLMNLGAGGAVAYTFSSPDLDLAVISLDQGDSSFADQLDKLGYQPVDSEHIDQQSVSEGDEIFTVGYPSSTSLICGLPKSTAVSVWSSKYISLPVCIFGKVSMTHKSLPFFWCDMSVYPGNSGGPVIRNGKLVGIVSEQAILKLDGLPAVMRIPFGKVVKSSYVLDLLRIQAAKDEELDSMNEGRKTRGRP